MRNVVLVVLLALFMAGCSRVTVPPASLGKNLSGSGYSVDIKPAGKYWVPWWEDMVILDVSTKTLSEKMTVRLADNLELTFTVRFRSRLGGSDKVLNAMFNDIRHQNYYIGLEQVYNVYGRDVVTNTARSVVSKHRAEEVAINFDKITQDLHKHISERLSNSPLEVANVTLADVIYPKVINDSIEAQASRRLAIETEQNQQAIEMVKKKNQLELAIKEKEIRIVKAEALRKENEITSKGLSPQLIQYRQLEVMEKLGENGNTIYYPFSAEGGVGLSNRIYSK